MSASPSALQAPELLEIYHKLVASGTDNAGDDVKVALGNAIRKLKQHWKLGECSGGQSVVNNVLL